MSADQFLTVDGRPTVRVERRYPHPIERVWEAVTTPEHLGTNASEGMHHVEMLNPDGGQTTFVSRIEELVPDERIVLTFKFDPDAEETKLTLTFDDAEGGSTTLRLDHERITSVGTLNGESVNVGWGQCLVKLQAYLET